MEVKYIVDTYNPYQLNRNVVGVYTINGHKYCIRQIAVEYEWGKPVVDFPEKPWDYEDSVSFYLYDTEEEARRYIASLKGV